MTNDKLSELLMAWPPGTEVSVLVDVNMSADIERVTGETTWNSDEGKVVPLILIELPTSDISSVPPLVLSPSP